MYCSPTSRGGKYISFLLNQWRLNAQQPTLLHLITVEGWQRRDELLHWLQHTMFQSSRMVRASTHTTYKYAFQTVRWRSSLSWAQKLTPSFPSLAIFSLMNHCRKMASLNYHVTSTASVWHWIGKKDLIVWWFCFHLLVYMILILIHCNQSEGLNMKRPYPRGD